MKKRVISILLAVLMIVSLLPATALASEAKITNISIEDKPVYLLPGWEHQLNYTVTTEPMGGVLTRYLCTSL